jgi:hypothetical protein
MENVETNEKIENNEKNVISKEPSKDEDDIRALSNNKVDVEIEPDVISNNVHVQMCSCSIVFNCFKPDIK